MRRKGGAEELELIRRLAVARVNEGQGVADVARVLGIHTASLRRWLLKVRRHGDTALASKPHPGRTRKLNKDQERVVLEWLKSSPRDCGLTQEIWTAPLLVAQIHKKFNVTFNTRYLNEWLACRSIRLRPPR